jgi:hypothetical protein
MLPYKTELALINDVHARAKSAHQLLQVMSIYHILLMYT